jgi:hypothetical protein
MSVLEAMAEASVAGVILTLDGDGIILETDTPPLPAAVVARLKSVKPDLLHILEWRDAALAALNAKPPLDAREDRWLEAMRGLRRFVVGGWGDRAALLGWTKEELYRVPPVWSRVDLTGAALMIGDRQVIAVTVANIVIETRSGPRLKFRRIGRSMWRGRTRGGTPCRGRRFQAQFC